MSTADTLYTFILTVIMAVGTHGNYRFNLATWFDNDFHSKMRTSF